ncbi:hypothetical protein FIM04_00325 [SAR202 cluster bacterium AC-409-J13_OGT_754m]|nr:hypothetical protein [SAR202 cluster bacterium AC-409-J13_OGT_754m]
MNSLYPLHVEAHRTSLLTRLIGWIGWGIILISMVSAVINPRDIISVLGFLGAGILLAASQWFLAPRWYELYNDRIIVTYGKPRERIVLFDEISAVQIHRSPVSLEIKIKIANNRIVSLTPLNPAEFEQKIMQAVTQYTGIEKR